MIKTNSLMRLFIPSSLISCLLFCFAIPVLSRQSAPGLFDQKAAAILPKVIEWRRYLHQHPELGNREFKTAEMVASHLKALGLEVQTGVAKTGVVGILRGGKPG